MKTIKNYKKSLINPDASLKEAMTKLSTDGGRVLFVTDENDKLLGSVTDGDIRRAILNGIEFSDPIKDVMFKFPRVVKRSERNYVKKIEQLMIEEKLEAIPVVDNANRVIDAYFLYEFLEKIPVKSHEAAPLPNTVVIMAGGKGSRLDPFTKILPKPLIPVGDLPIVEVIMNNFHKDGFSNFILTLNYKKELIKLYFKENKLPYNIELVEEGDFLGTAGSLGLLKNKLKDTFYVCNCDVMLENNFRNILQWHKGEKAAMTLIGCHKEMVIPYGTLQVHGGHLKSIKEKPKYDMIINTGVYVMEPEILKLIKKGEHLEMNHLVERALKTKKLTVYPVTSGWSDIGQWKEYHESIYKLENANPAQA
jgi:dTDP-glucose pyrophosphorylase